MIVGLDIGTCWIRVAIAEIDEFGHLRIAGTSCEKSVGLRNGNIVNIEAASNAIRNAIESAEQNAGVEVNSCYTIIGGDQIDGMNATGKVQVSAKGKSHREISEEDIRRVKESASAVQLALDREMLHVITQEYIVDGVNGIKDPMHRLGVCLEAAIHMITASRTTIQNMQSCIVRAGYTMEGVMLKTLAATHAVANDDEMELGSIVVDMGAGTTDILVLLHGAPVCTASIPVGGNHVTNDIAYCLGIPAPEAEKIKIEAGCCYLENVDKNRTVIINGIGGQPPREILQSELCEIINARVEEIFEMIKQKIITKTKITQISGNIILIGGGTKMEGIVELVQDSFGTYNVRIGMPENLGGIFEDYNGPDWATVIGLVRASKDNAGKSLKKKTKVVKNTKIKENRGENKILNMIRSFF